MPSPIDPGPRCPPELGRKARAAASALLERLKPLNVPFAVESLRANPPEPEAVALLAVYAHDLWTREKQSQISRDWSRRPDLTKPILGRFKGKFERENDGKDWGWKTAAMYEFNTDIRTINKKLKE
jgi:hypothetical protein